MERHGDRMCLLACCDFFFSLPPRFLSRRWQDLDFALRRATAGGNPQGCHGLTVGQVF